MSRPRLDCLKLSDFGYFLFVVITLNRGLIAHNKEDTGGTNRKAHQLNCLAESEKYIELLWLEILTS